MNTLNENRLQQPQVLLLGGLQLTEIDFDPFRRKARLRFFTRIEGPTTTSFTLEHRACLDIFLSAGKPPTGPPCANEALKRFRPGPVAPFFNS